MKEINPHKALAWAVVIVAYVVMTVAVLGVHVPKLLREADTTTNIVGVILVIAWLLISLYVVALIRGRKRKPMKRNRRK